MMKWWEIFLEGLVSSITALIVFFISERIKKVSLDRVAFQKLSLKIYETIIIIEEMKSSINDFLKYTRTYSLHQLWSIWFPEYSLPAFLDDIPWNYNITEPLIKGVQYSNKINTFFRQIQINTIKGDFLSGRVNEYDTEKRYKQEAMYISKFIRNIETYQLYFIRLYAHVNLINKHKNILWYINIKTCFRECVIESNAKNFRENLKQKSEILKE